MVDRDKVIKGLELCTADIPIENGIHKDDMCQKCPYHNKKYAYCFEKNKLMQDALALLKEQETIVRCKDCKYAHMTYDGECKYCDMFTDDDGRYVECYYPGDWYCADGERLETE
jgi:hypothetical protein